MNVAVKWIKSPRAKYGIPRAPGTWSSLDVKLAKQIRKEAPDMFYSSELDELERKPKKVKTPFMKRAKTRPVEKED